MGEARLLSVPFDISIVGGGEESGEGDEEG
jgi:hypothetical protein